MSHKKCSSLWNNPHNLTTKINLLFPRQQFPVIYFIINSPPFSFLSYKTESIYIYANRDRLFMSVWNLYAQRKHKKSSSIGGPKPSLPSLSLSNSSVFVVPPCLLCWALKVWSWPQPWPSQALSSSLLSLGRRLSYQPNFLIATIPSKIQRKLLCVLACVQVLGFLFLLLILSLLVFLGSVIPFLFLGFFFLSWRIVAKILWFLFCFSLGDKKRERKKKKVHFAKNVVKEPTGGGEEMVMRKQSKVERRSCRNEIPENRIALYNGILKNRVERMQCSHWPLEISGVSWDLGWQKKNLGFLWL